MIKAIIFDIGGVLLDSIGSKTLEDIARAFNITKEEVSKLLYEDLGPLQKAEITEKEYWERFAKKIQRPLPFNYSILWSKEFLSDYVANDENLKLVKVLRQKGYKTATLSNTILSHSYYIRKLIDQRDFDVFVLSNETKLRKPEMEAYENVVDRLSMQPSSCTLVDDDKSFIDAGINIGLNGILYTNYETLVKNLRLFGIKV